MGRADRFAKAAFALLCIGSLVGFLVYPVMLLAAARLRVFGAAVAALVVLILILGMRELDMPLMWQANTLTMSWCLDCHRGPEKYVRPRDQVYNMNYDAAKYLEELAKAGTPRAEKTPEELGEKLVEEYHIRKGQLLNCSICHR